MSRKAPLPPLGKDSVVEEELSPISPECASAHLDWKDLPVVVTETCYGRVAGLNGADGLILFLGMPYALAPKGTLRFRPPQELMPWEGILPAFRFGPVCPCLHSWWSLHRRFFGGISLRWLSSVP
jgi:hypothetical protein